MPIREIEIETEAKAQDISLSIIVEVIQFCDDLPNMAEERFVTQLKAHGLLDHFFAKKHLFKKGIFLLWFFFCDSSPAIPLHQNDTIDFEDVLIYLPNKHYPLDLK